MGIYHEKQIEEIGNQKRTGPTRVQIDTDVESCPTCQTPHARSLAQTEQARAAEPARHCARLDRTDRALERQNAPHTGQLALRLQSGVFTALLRNQTSHDRHRKETQFHSSFASQQKNPDGTTSHTSSFAKPAVAVASVLYFCRASSDHIRSLGAANR